MDQDALNSKSSFKGTVHPEIKKKNITKTIYITKQLHRQEVTYLFSNIDALVS